MFYWNHTTIHSYWRSLCFVISRYILQYETISTNITNSTHIVLPNKILFPKLDEPLTGKIYKSQKKRKLFGKGEEMGLREWVVQEYIDVQGTDSRRAKAYSTRLGRPGVTSLVCWKLSSYSFLDLGLFVKQLSELSFYFKISTGSIYIAK